MTCHNPMHEAFPRGATMFVLPDIGHFTHVESLGPRRVASTRTCYIKHFAYVKWSRSVGAANNMVVPLSTAFHVAGRRCSDEPLRIVHE